MSLIIVKSCTVALCKASSSVVAKTGAVLIKTAVASILVSKSGIGSMGILSATLVAGLIGWFYKKDKRKVEDFRKTIENLNDPVLIENKLIELLPQAQKLTNTTTYVQILSKIAASQAMQEKFGQARKTLDQAQLACKADDYEGQACMLLEQGKIFELIGDFHGATAAFHACYRLALQHNLVIKEEASKCVKLLS